MNGGGRAILYDAEAKPVSIAMRSAHMQRTARGCLLLGEIVRCRTV